MAAPLGLVDVACPYGGTCSFDSLTGNPEYVYDQPGQPDATTQQVTVLVFQAPAYLNPNSGQYTEADDMFNTSIGIGLRDLVDAIDPEAVEEIITRRVLAGLSKIPNIVSNPIPTVTFSTDDTISALQRALQADDAAEMLPFTISFQTVSGLVVTIPNNLPN